MSDALDANDPLARLLVQASAAVLSDWNVQFGTAFDVLGDTADRGEASHWVWIQLGLCGAVYAPLHVVLDARVLRSAVEALGFVDLPEADFGGEGLDAVRELANLMAGAYSRVFSEAVEGLRVTQRQSDILVDVLDRAACEARVVALADCASQDLALACPTGGPWPCFVAVPRSAVEGVGARLRSDRAA
jgi:hypothetical protein